MDFLNREQVSDETRNTAKQIYDHLEALITWSYATNGKMDFKEFQRILAAAKKTWGIKHE
jgi:hypothetical protein